MTAPDERRVLGFDLRSRPTAGRGSMSAAVRAQRFTEREPETRISVDPAVLQRPDGVTSIIDGCAGGTDPIAWNPLGLAMDPDGLTAACGAAGIAADDLLPLAFTGDEAIRIGLETRFGSFWRGPTECRLAEAGWRHLGFDAVDLSGLISGLGGTGYAEGPGRDYRRLFAGAINAHGLFDCVRPAQRFAEARGLEIPVHAPFVVVGVLTPVDTV